MSVRAHLKPVEVEVSLDVQLSTPVAAIGALASRLAVRLGREVLAQALPAACARESQASTYLGHETALPHARLKGETPWLISFGRFSPGVAWGPNGETARFVFLTLIPREATAAYLGFVRDLGRAMRNDTVRRELAAAGDEGAVRCWLRNYLRLG